MPAVIADQLVPAEIAQNPRLSGELQREVEDSMGIEGRRVLEQLARKRAFDRSDPARNLRHRTHGVWTADAGEKYKYPVIVVPGEVFYTQLASSAGILRVKPMNETMVMASCGGELKESSFTAEQQTRFARAKKE